MAGCASTQVTSHQPYQGEKLPRPGRIIVHDFVADPADLPAGSPLAAQAAPASPAPSASELELGRQLGAQVAEALGVRSRDEVAWVDLENGRVGLPGIADGLERGSPS